MLNTFYLFFIPLLVVCIYIAVKFFQHKEEIEKLEKNAFISSEDLPNNIDIAKDMVFDFIDGSKFTILNFSKISFHWFLHFFVLFLGFISDMTDLLYTKARDFFLKTATKEKGAVSMFWDYLKEYKKEKEEENQE